jgi:hypothetical protein
MAMEADPTLLLDVGRVHRRVERGDVRVLVSRENALLTPP